MTATLDLDRVIVTMPGKSEPVWQASCRYCQRYARPCGRHTAAARISVGNARAYYGDAARRAIRQARTYHAAAYVGGPNFSACTRTEYRAYARACLAAAAHHRANLAAVLAAARTQIGA